MKRALAVVLAGIGIVTISTLVGRRGADERFTAAKNAVDADCRAYRSQSVNRNADVCRTDTYGPKAIPLYNEAKPLLEHARSALAHGDPHAAESDLSRVVGITDDLAHVGTSLAQIIRASLVKSIIEIAADHREVDATRLLRDVHLDDIAKHPFAAESLQHRWYLAHWNEMSGEHSRSAGDLADAMTTDTATYAEIEKLLVEDHNVEGCVAIARKQELFAVVLCPKLNEVVETSRRLDAVQHGRLSSARR